MGTQEQIYLGICGLCLKICDNNRTIGDVKNALDIVLSKINLAVIQELMMCTHCTEVLMKCFDFKATCIYTYDYIIPFANKGKVKLNLKDVYLSKNQNGTGVPEDHDVCGFCMSPLKNCLAISFNVEKDIVLKKMMEQCLSELDLSIIEKPVMCPPCHGSLVNCFRFVTNCLTVEERIKKYCESIELSKEDRIEPGSFLQFSMRDVISEVDDNSVNIVKVEETFCGESESELKEDLVGMEDKKFLVEEKIEIETNEEDFNRFDDDVVLPKLEVTTMLCKRQTFLTPNLKANPSCISANEKVTIRKCDSYSFQSKHKGSLKSHLLVNKDPPDVTMYKCYSCSYQTKHKSHLKTHILIHKDPSDVTMYNCDSCSYQTKYKSDLNRHKVIHKNLSKITMYKCDSCSYQTKYERVLNRHIVMHTDLSDTAMYKCDTCSYQTKYKGRLKTHILKHKYPSDVTMYKCYSCSYQTKHKSHLKIHILTHKDPSDVKMYQCDSCSYQTKYKSDLKRHKVIHMDLSKMTVYKCDSCSYQTKYERALETHKVMHTDPSDATMYKCDSCSFQTKHKSHLKIHILTHKDPSDVKMYQCDSCSYQTKYKSDLKRHKVIHMDLSKITVYKCDSCSYQTKYERALKTHKVMHTDPSDATMYKCDSCSFQTKYQRNLKKHILRHGSLRCNNVQI